MKNIIDKIIVLILAALIFSCSSDDDFPVPQASTVDVDYSFSIDNEAFAPATVTFTNETRVAEGKTATYSWSFGDGTSSAEANPSHFYESPGSYKVTLTAVTDNDLDFVEKTVTIKDPEALLVDLYLIDADLQSIELVNGGSIQIDATGYGLDYDPVNEVMYFTNNSEGSLMRVDLNGENLETVASGLTSPRGVAIDSENGFAYVTDRGVDAVYKINLSDGTSTILYDISDDPLFSLPVGIDYYNDNLYITCVDFDAESVWVGGTDGSGVSRIIDFAGGGFGYGITVDKGNERIYFDDNQNGFIKSANLDGTDIQNIVEVSDRVYGLAIDNINNKLYYTVSLSGSIFMSDLNGENVVTLSSDYSDPLEIFFIP
ncbi:MAG: PKD domain-containing protein [Fulvivirga sp.]|uniref:PKD domain-containing protein n=1 Tax=Fulvivirga sp. TaxID=1931237 RepID=UPI0032ECFCF3